MDEARIAQHAFERAQRGLDAWRRGAVGWTGEEYVVAGDHGTLYVVDLEDESCTCKDSSVRHEVCKHLYAATVERAKTGNGNGNGR